MSNTGITASPKTQILTDAVPNLYYVDNVRFTCRLLP